MRRVPVRTLGKPAVLFLAVALAAAPAAGIQPSGEEPFPLARVAHAGGAYDGATYTNSYEALDSNLKAGFTHFEIDLSLTSDGAVVCIHDWEKSFERSFGFPASERPTLETFEYLALHASKYHKCTLAGLATWMASNPRTWLVTDAKSDNLRVLEIISRVIPDAPKRVIPQIYQPENYERVRRLGYEAIIWTLYRYAGTDADVTRLVAGLRGRIAITMPIERASSELPAALEKMGVPTFAHTVNDAVRAKELFQLYHVSEIYTDALVPGTPVRDAEKTP